jgi:hypothetical protein
MSTPPFRFCIQPFLSLAGIVLLSSVLVADEPQGISGIIIDDTAKPVAGVKIAELWKSIDGDSQSVTGSVRVSTVPLREPVSVSDKSGHFAFKSDGSSLGFLAIDTNEESGAILFQHELIARAENTVCIRRLTEVQCHIPREFQSKVLDRFVLTISLQGIESRPLASTELIYITGVCGTYRFKLPPGSYHLRIVAFTKSEPALELGLTHEFDFEIDGQQEFDLGELELRVYTDPRQDYVRKISALRRRQASKESKSREDLYGLLSPQWKAIDGERIDHLCNVEALRGKWVLLKFWGVECLSCIQEEIPQLIDFYEKNSRDRSRFEIVGLYLDLSGQLQDIAALHQQLKPIKEHVWNGKEINFPIILDNTFSNWEPFAISGLGDCLLISPDGRIVPGGTDRLQEILLR